MEKVLEKIVAILKLPIRFIFTIASIYGASFNFARNCNIVRCQGWKN